MASTLIVEDGSGISNADSFNSISEIGTYATAYGLTWTGADAVKDVAARQATIYLEAVYGGRIMGSRVSSTQALSWPRNYVEDPELESVGYTDSYYVPNNVVPQRWKDAHAEMSVKALTEDILPDVTNSGSVKSTSIQVGPISEAIEYGNLNSPVKWYRKVDLLVSRYLHNSIITRRA